MTWYSVSDVEACEIADLPDREGVRVRIETLDRGASAHCPAVSIEGVTRSAVIRYVSDHWGQDDDIWFDEWIVDRVEEHDGELPPYTREEVAQWAILHTYAGAWGLKASEEDAVLSVLCALYGWPTGADGIYLMREHADIVDVCVDYWDGLSDGTWIGGSTNAGRWMLDRLDSIPTSRYIVQHARTR